MAADENEALRAERDRLRNELAQLRDSCQRQLAQLEEENKALRLRVRSLERLTWQLEGSDSEDDAPAPRAAASVSGAAVGAAGASPVPTAAQPAVLSRPFDSASFLAFTLLCDVQGAHSGRNITALAMSDDLRGLVFSGGVDKSLQIHGIHGELLFQHAVSAPVLAIALHRPGPEMCVPLPQRPSIARPSPRPTPSPHSPTIAGAASAFAAVGCMDGSVTLLSLAGAPDSLSIAAETRMRDHGKHITTCCFSPDGALLATASSDATARVYAVAAAGDGLALHWHAALPGPVQHGTFAPRPDVVLSRAGPRGGGSRVVDLASPLDGRPTARRHALLLACRGTSMLHVLDTERGAWAGINLNERPGDAHTSFAPLRLAAQGEGEALAVVHDLGGTLVVDLATGALLHAMHAVPVDEYSTPSAAWASRSLPVLLAAGKDGGNVHVLHAGMGRQVGVHRAHAAVLRASAAAVWDGEAACLATCAFDKAHPLRIWRVGPEGAGAHPAPAP